jgi:hypothetical protein
VMPGALREHASEEPAARCIARAVVEIERRATTAGKLRTTRRRNSMRREWRGEGDA